MIRLKTHCINVRNKYIMICHDACRDIHIHIEAESAYEAELEFCKKLAEYFEPEELVNVRTKFKWK